MKNVLADNVVAFAKIFGLEITNWQENNNSINFYYNNSLVGSISLENNEYEDDFTNSKGYFFTLNTSIGKIKGIYELASEAFLYSFERINDNTSIYNVTYGSAGSLLKKDKFIIMQRDDASKKSFVRVIMSNNSIEIDCRNDKGVRNNFDYFGPNDNEYPINITFNYIKSYKGDVFGEAKMHIEEDQKSKSFIIDFKFLKEKYSMKVDYNGNSFTEKLQSIDFNKLMEEVKRECPYFLSFINSIKEELSFTYLDDKKINIYDIIASLCFESTESPIFTISLAEPTTINKEKPAKLVKKI